MKTSDTMDIQGYLTLMLHDRNGQPVQKMQAKNSIVLSGRDLVAKKFVGIAGDHISHIAVGTGTANVTATDIELGTEIFRKPIKPVVHQDLTTTPDNRKKVTISAELDFPEGNGALTEAALFNNITNGVMYNRVKFSPVNKTADFKLTLIWEIIF